MPRLYSLKRWSSTLFHFGYFLSFFPPRFSLSLRDSLLNLLDMRPSLCVRNARFELTLNAINFLLVRHFCLILNNFAHNKEAIKCVRWYSSTFTPCFALIYLLSLIPQILWHQTQHWVALVLRASCSVRHPEACWQRRAVSQRGFRRQRSSFLSKLEKGKAFRHLEIIHSFYCAGVAPCQHEECYWHICSILYVHH